MFSLIVLVHFLISFIFYITFVILETYLSNYNIDFTPGRHSPQISVETVRRRCYAFVIYGVETPYRGYVLTPVLRRRRQAWTRESSFCIDTPDSWERVREANDSPPRSEHLSLYWRVISLPGALFRMSSRSTWFFSSRNNPIFEISSMTTLDVIPQDSTRTTSMLKVYW